MKLEIAGIENSIDLNEASINILEVENKSLFKKIVTDFNNIIKNDYETKEIILSEEDNIKRIDKEVEIYIDILNIDFNSKELLSKLYSRIEKNILLEQSVDIKLLQILQELRTYMNEIVLEFPFDCNMKNEIQIKDLIKCLDIKLNTDYAESLEEKLFLLFDIIAEFNLKKILIFANLKSYFEDETLIEIYKSAIKNNLNLILIESKLCSEKIKYEKKLIIDKEFDDFYN